MKRSPRIGKDRLTMGARIGFLRAVKSLTLRQLARESRVSCGYLSQLETGQQDNPTLDIVFRLAAALGCRVSFLIEGVT